MNRTMVGLLIAVSFCALSSAGPVTVAVVTDEKPTPADPAAARRSSRKSNRSSSDLYNQRNMADPRSKTDKTGSVPIKSTTQPATQPPLKPDYKKGEQLAAIIKEAYDRHQSPWPVCSMLLKETNALDKGMRSGLAALVEKSDERVGPTQLHYWSIAAYALGEIGDKRALPFLAARLKTPYTRRPDYFFVRPMGQLGVKAIVPRLVRWLGEEDKEDRVWRIGSSLYGSHANYILEALQAITGKDFGAVSGGRGDRNQKKKKQILAAINTWWAVEGRNIYGPLEPDVKLSSKPTPQPRDAAGDMLGKEVAEKVANWRKDFRSDDAAVRLKAIRKAENWVVNGTHPAEALYNDDLARRRHAAAKLDAGGRQEIIALLLARLEKNITNRSGYKHGWAVTEAAGSMRMTYRYRVPSENEALASALKELGAKQAVPLMKRAHAFLRKLPAREKGFSTFYTFAHCIYKLSMERVDVFMDGAMKPYETGPILEEQALQFLRPDLTPTGGLTASLGATSLAVYPQFFYGDATLVLVLTVTNHSDQPVPIDLSPETIRFSSIDKHGKRVHIPATKMPKPAPGAMPDILAPKETTTYTWRIEPLKNSPIGRLMNGHNSYMHLKAIYTPASKLARQHRGQAGPLVSNTLNRRHFDHDTIKKPLGPVTPLPASTTQPAVKPAHNFTKALVGAVRAKNQWKKWSVTEPKDIDRLVVFFPGVDALKPSVWLRKDKNVLLTRADGKNVMLALSGDWRSWDAGLDVKTGKPTIRPVRGNLKAFLDELDKRPPAAVKLASPVVVEALFEQLSSEDYKVWLPASRKLGEIANRGIVKRLGKIVADGAAEYYHRCAAVRALGYVRGHTVYVMPILVGAVGARGIDEKGVFEALTMQAVNDKAALPFIIQAGSREEIQWRCGHIIWKDIGPAAIPFLLKAIHDPGCRDWVTCALHELAPDAAAATDELILSLDASSIGTQRAAALTLVGIGLPAPKAIPALLRMLNDKKGSVASVAAAADALGVVAPRSRQVVKALTRALGRQKAEVRRSAARALGRIGPSAVSALDPLTVLLKDKNVYVRTFSAEAIGRLGPKARKATPLLSDMLKDKNIDVRCAASLAIWRLTGDVGPALGTLIRDLQSKDSWDQQRAAETLGKIGPPAAPATGALVKVLGAIRSFGSADLGQDREAAANAMGRIGQSAQSAMPALIKALSDPRGRVRKAAAKAITMIDRDGRVNAYNETMRALAVNRAGPARVTTQPAASVARSKKYVSLDPDFGTKPEKLTPAELWKLTRAATIFGADKQAAQRLIKIGQPAIAPLVRVLGSKKWWDDPVINASRILVCIGPPAVPALIQGLNGSSGGGPAAGVLGRIGDPRAVEPLITNLAHCKPWAKRSVIEALGSLKDRRAVKPLIALLADSEYNASAARALGMIGDRRAVEPLIKAVEKKLREESNDISGSEVPDIICCGGEALGSLGDKRAVGLLLKLIKLSQCAFEMDFVSDALGKIDDPGCVPKLAKLLRSHDKYPHIDDEYHASRIRRRTAYALSQMQSPAAFDALISALGDELPAVRAGAAYFLGLKGDRRAIGPISTLLTDKVDLVRNAAAKALKRLKAAPAPAREGSASAAEIASQVQGRIATVYVKLGQRVIKGQLLETLEKSEFKLRIRKAELECKIRRQAAAEAKAKRAKQEASARELEVAQAEAAVADVRLKQHKLALAQCEIRSPLDGTVTFVSVCLPKSPSGTDLKNN
jgi:HEAT repeat protein